ncbi:MAG: hydroxyacylglutathione hydrolase [Gammaproteobacteria bacterium]|nr:hydroxyacylglutathione hydrolase [Gammaproteobacteria bacterium]
MIIKTIWTANAYRNFNYLVVCEDTGEALAIDPLDHKKCLTACAEEGWNIRQILNTHEHFDHIGGNDQIVAATGAKILAHHEAGPRIPGMNTGLHAGDHIKVGRSVELEVMDTPGHTMSHVCVIAHADDAALFCGDTLFNAGAGNCHNGGHPDELFNTFTKLLHPLGHDTRIYPGHDYLANNLGFTLDREPGNQAAADLLESARSMDPAHPIVTTIGQEYEINTFFRLAVPEIIDKLKNDVAGLPPRPDPHAVFLKLRELRNRW